MEDDILLPQQVIDRLEHRWASRLQQDLKMWSDRSRPAPVRHVLTDGARVSPVVVKRARRKTAAGPHLRGVRLDSYRFSRSSTWIDA